MTFLAPERLLLLLAVVALAAAYLVVSLRRRRYAVRFASLPLLASVAPRGPGWRRHVPAVMFLLLAATLVTAFARPQAETRVPRERATILLAIDTSLSMQANDVEPTRLLAAEAAASSFVDLLPKKFNVGLVTFSGTANLVVPPTQDHAAVKAALGTLTLGPRTAIGEAVFTSLDAVKLAPGGGPDAAPAPARIVLMSDGANTVGRSDQVAAAAAKDAGVPVSTIAYGTESGEVVVGGLRVPVPVDTEALRQLAQATGGSAFSAQSEGELRKVYADIGSQVGYTTELTEVTSAFVGGGLALALLTGLASLVWFARLP